MPNYRFGHFHFDTELEELGRNGDVRSLRPKTAMLLNYLLDHRATIVNKAELQDHLWPGQETSSNNLVQSIRELRLALEDNPRDPTYIRTVPGRGYRWIFEPTEPMPGPDSPQPEPEPLPTSHPEPNQKPEPAKRSFWLLSPIALALFVWFLSSQLRDSTPDTEPQTPEIQRALLHVNPPPDLEDPQWLQHFQDMDAVDVRPAPPLPEDETAYAQLLSQEGAQHLITGTFEETATGLVFSGAHFTREGLLTRISLHLANGEQGLDLTVLALKGMLGQGLHPPDLPAFSSASPEVNRDVLQGMQALNTEGALLARPYFEAALVREPGFPGALEGLAISLFYLGELKESERIFQQLLAREDLIPPLQARARAGLGAVYVITGNLTAAEKILVEARDTARRLEDAYLTARVSIHLGDMAAKRGSWPASEELYLQAKERFARLGMKRGEADALFQMGTSFLRNSPQADDRDHLALAVQYHDEIGDLRGKVWAVWAQHFTRGDPQPIAEVKALFQQVGDVRGRLFCDIYDGNYAMLTGKSEEGAAILLRVANELETIGARSMEASTRSLLCRGLWTAGQTGSVENYLERALKHGTAARQLFKDMGMETGQYYTDYYLGLISMEKGDVENGLAFLTEGLEGFRKLHMDSPRYQTLIVLGRHFMEEKQWSKAWDLLEEAVLLQTDEDIQLLDLRARCAYEMKNYEEAVALGQRLIDLHGEDAPEALLERQKIYEATAGGSTHVEVK